MAFADVHIRVKNPTDIMLFYTLFDIVARMTLPAMIVKLEITLINLDKIKLQCIHYAGCAEFSYLGNRPLIA